MRSMEYLSHLFEFRSVYYLNSDQFLPECRSVNFACMQKLGQKIQNYSCECNQDEMFQLYYGSYIVDIFLGFALSTPMFG